MSTSTCSSVPGVLKGAGNLELWWVKGNGEIGLRWVKGNEETALACEREVGIWALVKGRAR